VTKLTRNIFLAAVIPILTWQHLKTGATRATRATGAIGAKRVSFKSLIPGFVIGFLAMAVVRSLGDWTLMRNGAALGIWSATQWASITKQLGDYWASQILLGTAMAAVGLNTNFAVFKGVGLKPFAVGMAGALVVGAVGLTMALIFGRFVHL
jgi:uncharacterized membrane protein YadS